MYQGQHGKGHGVGQQGSEAGSWQLSFLRDTDTTRQILLTL